MLTEAELREPFAYLTTTGRRTGEPHQIEIWFGCNGETVYLLAGGRDSADWVKNLREEPRVNLRIGERVWNATARPIDPGTDEDDLARLLLVEKYAPTYSGDLSEWRVSALPVAIDLQ